MKRFGTRSATGKMVKLKLPVDVESLLIEASNRSGRSRSFEAVIRLKDHLHRYPEMDIKIPFLTVMETLQYKPAESAASVQCPVLVVIAGQDSVNPPEQGRALYDAVASGTKELYEEADACHYDIYEGAFFERVVAVQTQWFKQYL